ncbi:MAG: hypothetical protein R2753_14760 [Chitinophagales bacterium]
MLIAELINFYGNEVLPINFQLKGQFERSYSKEILNTNTKFDGSGDEYLQVELSREGIYDGLPIFALHTIIKKQKRGKSLKNDVTLSKEIVQEEEAARQFFNPFEQEIYRLKGQIFKDEFDFKLSLDVFKDYFYDLISDGTDFSLNVLLTLLPHIHSLRGGIDKFQQLIKKVLKTDVTIEKKLLNDITLDKNDEIHLGELLLGHNSVLDTTSLGFMWGYSIDIKQSEASYERSEEIKKIVRFLGDLSLSSDLTYDVNVSVYESQFVLSDNLEKCPILAYNTII